MSTPEVFDYIIVGGGTAGLVVAARLTEDPDVSVCVIEAGGDHIHELDNQVPGLAFRNLGRPDIHFMFNTVPQKYANNRQIFVPRGKALGGSSSVNYMTLGRGHKDEFDAFEKLGNKGWNWENLLGYMKKSETYTVSSTEADKFGVKFDPKSHGDSGLIHRTLPKWIPGSYDDVFKAFMGAGMHHNTDPANGDNTGVFANMFAIHHSKVTRSAAAPAYYEPIKQRSNLHVITEAHATRLLSEDAKSGEKITFTGVEYNKGGTIHSVSARQEVILSAGAFSTPQILELSGIGDKGLLETHGITPILDLPGVGKNLRESLKPDHFWVWTTFEADPSIETLDVLQDIDRINLELQKYETSKTGMLSTVGGPIFSFVPTPVFANEGIVNHLTKVAEELVIKSDHPKSLRIQTEWTMGNRVPTVEIAYVPSFMPGIGTKPEPGKRYCSMLVAIQHPYSRGTVHIASNDPLAAPAIDHSCLDNEIDMTLLVEGVRYSRKIASALGKVVLGEVHPGEEVRSDEALKEVIRNTILTVFHPVGTAAMLPLEDGGVVDARLKVHGTKNLRIVDASILPIHVSNHPMTIVYGIGEKASDLIKEDRVLGS